jgi:sigma-B regulation protein RsbU (phosphoserine phosphatase)
MLLDKDNRPGRKSVSDQLKRFEILASEANTVREKDKKHIRSLFRNFYNKPLNVGIGFQRAYGSILSGDFFDLIKLPDGNYLFIFADISGHGLPAYTSLIKLRSAVTIAIDDAEILFRETGILDEGYLIGEVTEKFTRIMERASSDEDFACVNFIFIRHEEKSFRFRFYNRGMLYPMIIHKEDGELTGISDLNQKNENWQPNRGFLLGYNLQKVLGEKYFNTPFADYMVREGDSVLFYSDGIIEAHNSTLSQEYGEERVMDLIRRHHDLPPQAVINFLFDSIYEFIGRPELQEDDMTAVLLDLPPVWD